jgi:hypothetical protein
LSGQTLLARSPPARWCDSTQGWMGGCRALRNRPFNDLLPTRDICAYRFASLIDRYHLLGVIWSGANCIMARTCIVCGGPTGSREHVFPAALGGRRTNKGIYCDDHNNAYSGLAGIISVQLAMFNAQLGVVGDHATEPTSATMTDAASGKQIEMSGEQVRFKEPQPIANIIADGQTVNEMRFNSRKEAEDWVREQKTRGFDVQSVGIEEKKAYYLGTAHKQINLGGDDEGLRAIGYIAQTFLAHSFPEVARLPELQGIKDYTLNGQGSGFVWWDFGPAPSLPPNEFPFGHRVIVGLNAEDNIVYARISFFSTLNFAILFGSVPVESSRAVITDIDPLAKSPPNDIKTRTQDSAIGAVSKPDNLTASLAEAISTGRARAQIVELMSRIADYQRRTAAAKILAKVGAAGTLGDSERNALFSKIVSDHAQRVFSLMGYLAKDARHRASNPFELAFATLLEKAVELDPAAEGGVSAQATRALDIACSALAKRMSKDSKAGKLDLDRIEMLIGGGHGAAEIGTALAHMYSPDP